MNKILGIILICATGMFASCGQCSQNLRELDSNDWKLKGTDGNNFAIKFSPNDSTINGVGDCNRFFGKYEIKGDKIKINMGGATMMMCPNADKEESFFTMLSKVDVYKIKDSVLTFYSNNNESAVFIPFNEANVGNNLK